jgi:hypothetical protein
MKIESRSGETCSISTKIAEELKHQMGSPALLVLGVCKCFSSGALPPSVRLTGNSCKRLYFKHLSPLPSTKFTGEPKSPCFIGRGLASDE